MGRFGERKGRVFVFEVFFRRIWMVRCECFRVIVFIWSRKVCDLFKVMWLVGIAFRIGVFFRSGCV